MLTIYKKVEKSKENPTGIVEIKDISELSKPVLICISAQDNYDKSLFGIIKIGAQAARVHTTEENAGYFKIDEMPVDFLGVRFTSDEKYTNKSDEMTDKFIFPLLLSKENISFEEVMENAKKLNFLTYCDGTINYIEIEQNLEKKLNDLGYSQEETQSILKNISLTAIGTMVDTSNLFATTSSFIDINDSEIYTEKTEYYQKVLEERQTESVIGNFNRENNKLYIYSGTGKHDLKEYLKNTARVKPILCTAVTHFLESSLPNSKKSKSDSKLLLQKLDDINKSPLSQEKLLSNLDNEITYSNAKRYSKEEVELRNELDQKYKDMAKVKRELDYYKRDLIRLQEQMKKLSENIKIYSSETAFLQIMTASGLWQANKEIFNQKTDKEIRSEYDSTLESTQHVR